MLWPRLMGVDVQHQIATVRVPLSMAPLNAVSSFSCGEVVMRHH